MKKKTKSTIDARTSIFNAAITLFSENGYDGTGVQQIADKAGVNKAMIYYYFGSKDELYDILLTEGEKIIESAINKTENKRLFIDERIRVFSKTLLCAAIEQPELTRLIYRELLGDGEQAKESVADNFRNNVELIAEKLEEGIKKGKIRDDINLLYTSYMIFGIINIFISKFVITGQLLDVESLVDDIVSMVLNGIGVKKDRGVE